MGGGIGPAGGRIRALLARLDTSGTQKGFRSATDRDGCVETVDCHRRVCQCVRRVGRGREGWVCKTRKESPLVPTDRPPLMTSVTMATKKQQTATFFHFHPPSF